MNNVSFSVPRFAEKLSTISNPALLCGLNVPSNSPVNKGLVIEVDETNAFAFLNEPSDCVFNEQLPALERSLKEDFVKSESSDSVVLIFSVANDKYRHSDFVLH